MRNKARRFLQLYGPNPGKRWLWNVEFASGRWVCLNESSADHFYDHLARHLNGGRILDVGCGSGTTGNELNSDSYRQYTGVDISDVAIAAAEQRTRITHRQEKNEYVCAAMETFSPDGCYDVILFRDSLYYIPPTRIRKVLDRYTSCLSPRGVFMARMHSRNTAALVLSAVGHHFTIVERHRLEKGAEVIVFRPNIPTERG